MKRIILLAVALCLSSTCFAASTGGPGVPSFLAPSNNGVVLIYFLWSTRAGTPPACATFHSGTYYRYAISVTTDAGKAMFADLLAAHTAGEQVYITGSGACDLKSDTETIASIGGAV
jgi:hypothetical protein